MRDFISEVIKYASYLSIPAVLLSVFNYTQIMGMWFVPLSVILGYAEYQMMYHQIQQVCVDYSVFIWLMTGTFFVIQAMSLWEMLAGLSIAAIWSIPLACIFALPRTLFVAGRLDRLLGIERLSHYIKSYVYALVVFGVLLMTSHLAWWPVLMTCALVTGLLHFQSFNEFFDFVHALVAPSDLSPMKIAQYIDHSLTYIGLFIHIAAELILPAYVASMVLGIQLQSIEQIPFLLMGAFESAIEFCNDFPMIHPSSHTHEHEPSHKQSSFLLHIHTPIAFVAAVARGVMMYTAMARLELPQFLARPVPILAGSFTVLVDYQVYRESMQQGVSNEHHHSWQLCQALVALCTARP